MQYLRIYSSIVIVYWYIYGNRNSDLPCLWRTVRQLQDGLFEEIHDRIVSMTWLFAVVRFKVPICYHGQSNGWRRYLPFSMSFKARSLVVAQHSLETNKVLQNNLWYPGSLHLTKKISENIWAAKLKQKSENILSGNLNSTLALKGTQSV